MRFARVADAERTFLTACRLKSDLHQICAKFFRARRDDDFLDSTFAKKFRLLRKQKSPYLQVAVVRNHKIKNHTQDAVRSLLRDEYARRRTIAQDEERYLIVHRAVFEVGQDAFDVAAIEI